VAAAAEPQSKIGLAARDGTSGGRLLRTAQRREPSVTSNPKDQTSSSQSYMLRCAEWAGEVAFGRHRGGLATFRRGLLSVVAGRIPALRDEERADYATPHTRIAQKLVIVGYHLGSSHDSSRR